MKRVFADANYFVALLNRKDQFHEAAIRAQRSLSNVQMVTTDEALIEVLAFFSVLGSEARRSAVQVVEGLRRDQRVAVIEQSRATFDGGLARYKQYADKEWSLVDCVSFELMKRDSITEALTDDHHFEQAGFVAVLRTRAK